MGAITFAILLTFKHLYIILAPFYFCYLLRRFCFVEYHFYDDDGKRKNRLSSPLIARLGSREVRVVHGGPVPDVRLDELPRVDGFRLRLDVPLEPKRHRLVAPLEDRSLDRGTRQTAQKLHPP